MKFITQQEGVVADSFTYSCKISNILLPNSLGFSIYKTEGAINEKFNNNLVIRLTWAHLLTVHNQRVKHWLLRVIGLLFFHMKKKNRIEKIVIYRSWTRFVTKLWRRKAISEWMQWMRATTNWTALPTLLLRVTKRVWHFSVQTVTQFAGCPCDTAAHSRLLFRMLI